MTPCRPAIAVVAVAALVGCSRQQPAENRLLVIDGIEITLADVEPYVAFLDSYLPEGGRKSKVLRALEDLVLPVRLARRAFPQQRDELRKGAEALCAVAGNVAELTAKSEFVKDKRRSNLTRSTAQLPVAMYAFDPLRVGGVSPPLEVPQGWFVVGVHDLHVSPGLVMDDYIDALQVGFVHHNAAQYLDWYRGEQERLADKATFVHPDYEHAMPSWLRVPRRP